jgi:hypothetical protein
MPSSVIRRFDYDEPGRRLHVTFQSGDLYDYFEVPPELPKRWKAATSKGRFFAEHIRDRYPYTLVEKAGR